MDDHGPNWDAYTDHTAASLERARVGDINPWSDGFRLEDQSAAGWALRRLGDAKAELSRIKSTAAEEIAIVNAWREDETRKVERFCARFEELLKEWFARNPPLDGKAKSRKLPGGTVGTKLAQDKATYDDAELVAELLALPDGIGADFVQVTAVLSESDWFNGQWNRATLTRKPKWAELKACLKFVEGKAVWNRGLPFDPNGYEFTSIVVAMGADEFYATPQKRMIGMTGGGAIE
jgi:hypothetical protein